MLAFYPFRKSAMWGKEHNLSIPVSVLKIFKLYMYEIKKNVFGSLYMV